MVEQIITAKAILDRWPDRQAVADDAGVEPIAVYRWEKRNRIPGHHDRALIAGARRRRIRLSLSELAEHRSKARSAA